MKKHTLAILLALLYGAFFMGTPAHAQKTKAELSAEVSTTFPDNTSGLITPTGVRAFQNDLINSIMPTAPVVSGNLACFNGTTGLLQDCGTAPDTITIGITNIASGTSSRILYNNAGKVAEYPITGTGDVVMSTGAAIGTPTITNPTFAGTASGAGTLPTTLLSGTLQAAQLGALTGDVTTPGGSYTTTIVPNAVTNAKMATMAANTVKGNATGGSAVPTDVAPAAARSSALLNIESFTGHGDSIYSIAATDRVVGTNAAFTASRTWTLPAANAVNPGQTILVADFQGTVTGSNTLIIARAGSDTINGGTSVTINSANGAYILVSDGSSKWTAQAVGASAASGVSSIDGASGAISTQAGSLEVTGSTLASNVLSSRAFAATQDLSAFNAIRTLGYASAGDGGGALYKNVGATQYLDQHVSAFTIAGGSGYTNGSYTFITLTGGTGQAFYANITVSGGAVTAVTKIFNAGGFGYSVGDVLTTSAGNIGGTGSGFSITITSVTTVYGSFADAAGNHWQYVPESAIDPRQFGVKMDWLGVDASATDNAATLQAAFNFASYSVTAQTTGGAGNSSGMKVLFPNGVAMVCSALQLWNSTQLQGQGLVNSGLHGCDAFSASGNFITIGDSVAQIACFGNRISDIDISVSYSASANAGTFALFSNCAQQGELINNVAIYPGARGCLDLEIGYGGAATLYSKGLFCTMANSPASEGVKFNYGTTLIHFIDTIIEASNATSATAVNALGGVITLDNFHSEGISHPVRVNMPISNHAIVLFNASGGSVCVDFVTLHSTNSPGNFAIFNSQKNGCTTLVANNQPGGLSRTDDARPASGWIGFNP